MAKRKSARKSAGPTALHAADNEAYVAELARFAARVASAGAPIRGFGAFVVFGDGSTGTVYGGPQTVVVVGGAELLKARIVADFNSR